MLRLSAKFVEPLCDLCFYTHISAQTYLIARCPVGIAVVGNNSLVFIKTRWQGDMRESA